MTPRKTWSTTRKSRPPGSPSYLTVLIVTASRSPFDVAAKRAAIGVSSGPVIGLAARLTEQKGVIFLLHAVVHLREQYPGLQVLIAGTGDQEEYLKRAAGQLGIANAVHFLGVRMDIPELVRAFDVFVIPSIWEGLPMALLEAFAAGTPVVASMLVASASDSSSREWVAGAGS